MKAKYIIESIKEVAAETYGEPPTKIYALIPERILKIYFAKHQTVVNPIDELALEGIKSMFPEYELVHDIVWSEETGLKIFVMKKETLLLEWITLTE